MDVAVVVGLNVQRLRRERGISQEELSFQSGCTRAHLSGIENGRGNPTISTLASLAKALHVDVGQLFAKPVKSRARAKQGHSKHARS